MDSPPRTGKFFQLFQLECLLTLHPYPVVATFSKSSPLVLPKDRALHRYSRGLRSFTVLVLARLKVGPSPTLRCWSRNCRRSHRQNGVGASRKTEEEVELMYTTSFLVSRPIDSINRVCWVITHCVWTSKSYRPTTPRRVPVKEVTTFVRRSPSTGPGLIRATAGLLSEWNG